MRNSVQSNVEVNNYTSVTVVEMFPRIVLLSLTPIHSHGEIMTARSDHFAQQKHPQHKQTPADDGCNKQSQVRELREQTVFGAGDQSADIKSYYDEKGYVILKGLIPDELIEALLSLYRKDIFQCRAKFFRQNTNLYDYNNYTTYGHVIQSFLDIHNYKRFPEFRQAALDLYFSDELLGALSKVTGHKKHNLMQSMLFDANAATPAHQDWWYLDSIPNGGLVGAWIALENIHEDAGRFFVMPGTHRLRLDEAGMRHSDWLAKIKTYMDADPGRVYAPALEKGDVLFWNSGTIHGALPTCDQKYSRKSTTAHFMPSGVTFGNLFKSKPWIAYEEVNGNHYFANQPEYSFKAEWVTRIKVAAYNQPWLLKLLRTMQTRSIAQIAQ
jgi:phytanoyl-CoA hydroxylase